MEATTQIGATTKNSLDSSYIVAAIGGILGGLWLIVWPFISWPLGTFLPSTIEKGEVEGYLDIVYGVLLIGCMVAGLYGARKGVSGQSLRNISRYGALLISIALLVVPFILGSNPQLFNAIPRGPNQDEYPFWQDMIAGTIALTFSLAYTLRRPSYIIGALVGFIGGLWLVIWPFIPWPPNTDLPAIWVRSNAIGILDIVYGVLLILFTFGCMFGWYVKLPGFTLGHVSLYGMLLLSIALLVVPFILGKNPAILGGVIPAGQNADPYAFWNDIITGLISLPFSVYYIVPHKPKAVVQAPVGITPSS